MAETSSVYAEPMVEGEQTLHSIASLIDHLNIGDIKMRLNSIQNLPTVALALGPERTRIELLPYITSIISNDDEEELMVAFADQLKNFTNYVGGPEFAYTLLMPLKELISSEVTIVRCKGIESLHQIAALLSSADFEKYFLGLVINLATNGWFTSQISSCGLFSVCYSRVGPVKKRELINLFEVLCHEKASMIRKAAAEHIEKLAKVVEPDTLKNYLLPLFLELVEDNQDTVRVVALEAFINTAPLLPHEDFNDLVLPTLRKCISESSWKVRYVVAVNIIEFQKAVGPEITCNELVPAFLSLLLDTEADVRATAVSKLFDFCKNLCIPVISDAFPNNAPIPDAVDSIIVTSFLPVIEELVQDLDVHVRSAMASAIMKLSPIFEKQRTLDHLLPLILTQLNDECPEVCLNIILNLKFVYEVIGTELLSETLLPIIFELCKNSNWRIRLAIVEYMPLLASQLGIQFFDDKLNSLFMSWLIDQVSAVREATTVNLKKLVEVFGAEWALMSVIPKIINLATDEKYSHRIIFLFCVNELADFCGSQIMIEHLITTVLSMASDRVANVRFNVAKTLKKISHIFAQDDGMKSQIKLVLNNLKYSDIDVDVKFFAADAMSTIPWI